MGTVKEKADYLKATKEGIRQAIVSHDVELPEDATFRNYVEKVEKLPTIKIEDCSYFFYKGKRYDQYEEINADIFPYAKNMSYLFHGADLELNTPLPADLNTQSCEDLSYAFYNNNSFCYVPNMDLSNCKNLNSAFREVWWLGDEVDFDTVPTWDTSKVEDMSYLFYNCMYALFRRNNGLMPQFDMQNVLDAKYMCYKCWQLVTVPVLNTAKCENFSYAFYDCDNLTTIEGIDMSSCTDASNMFAGCTLLKKLVFTGSSVPDFSIASCAFDRDGMVEMFASLPDGGSATITITGNPCVTDGTLTDDDKAIATNKGYTLTV